MTPSEESSEEDSAEHNDQYNIDNILNNNLNTMFPRKIYSEKQIEDESSTSSNKTPKQLSGNNISYQHLE